MDHPILKQKAYAIIREKLLSLEFQPGSRIREDLLAQEIDMSRTPVREALNQLASEGLVTNIPRKGIYFIDLSKNEINKLFDVREPLAVLAVEKCIDKIDNEGLNRLDDILGKYRKALDAEDYEAFSKLDCAFHKEIANITGNRKLIEFTASIEDMMRITRGKEPRSPDQAIRDRTFAKHYAVYDCIKNRDKAGAIEAIKLIVNGTRDLLNREEDAGDENNNMVAVGMPVTRHPPRRSAREELSHTAPAAGNNAKAH